jgi:hypothetical protein
MPVIPAMEEAYQGELWSEVGLDKNAKPYQKNY